MSNKKKRRVQQTGSGSGKPKRNRLMIASVAIVAIVAVVVVSMALAGGGDKQGSINSQNNTVANDDKPVDGSQVNTFASRPEGPIKATWVTAGVEGNSVSVSKSELESAGIIHFKVPSDDGELAFMAYTEDGDINVRANVCPPCRSIGFSLNGDELVCDSCLTRFEADTGAGISGACKDFPKASVDYQTDGDAIVMQTGDLVTAHENTTKPGWP